MFRPLTIDALRAKFSEGYDVRLIDMAVIPNDIENLRNTIIVSGLETTLDVLKHESGQRRHLIVLRQRLKQPYEFFTDDVELIEATKQHIKYLNEPVALQYKLECIIAGSDELNAVLPVVLPGFIESLAQLFKGKIRIRRPDLFTLEGRLHSVLMSDGLTEVEDINATLALVAQLRGVGIQVLKMKFIPIARRERPSMEVVHQPRIIEPLSGREIEVIKKLRALPNKEAVASAAIGLNRSFFESLPGSRIGHLWTTVEETFYSSKGINPLFEDAEVRKFIDFMKQEKIDPVRIRKFTDYVGQLKGVSRNEIIIQNIQKLTGKTYQQSKELVHTLSGLRGKLLHRVIADANIQNIRKSESEFTSIIRSFILSQNSKESSD